jgi:cytochrome P450
MRALEVEPVYYDPYDYAIDNDPHPVWRRMREEAPLYWNERYGFWALSRFEDVWNVYHDTKTFSSSHGVELERLDEPAEYPSMIFMDPPEHDNLRKLVSRAFTPRRISALEASIRALSKEYLDPHIGSESFDYVSEFAALLPPMVIGELLGVPESDRNRLRLLVDEILHREEGQTDMSAAALAASIETYEYLVAMIAERRGSPGDDDLVSALISAEVEQAGVRRALTEEEIVSFIILLNGAGVETVARLFSWAAVTLARYPDQRALLVEDPSLIGNAVEELLRFEAPSPVNGRWVTRPVEFHGVTIPAESKLLMLNGSANRDQREFSDPDRFDVRRDLQRHITFGHGAHFCLGAALARMEGRIGIAETLKRFPRWEIDEDKLVMVRTSTVRGYSSVGMHLG